MVCSKCEKKQLSSNKRIITPETWKDGSSQPTKVNENKLLSSKKLTGKNSFEPYAASCKLCSAKLHQKGHAYCQKCAYKKGICGMCGIKMVDTSKYVQRTV